MADWKSYTKSYRMADFQGVAPAWAIEQRRRQAAQISELRDCRLRDARRLFASVVLAQLAGAGPWPFGPFYSRWRDACCSIADWNYRYKSRWVRHQLVAQGYRMTGDNRKPVIYVRNQDSGIKERKMGAAVDKRMIERAHSPIFEI